jgi:hypothetical protein
LRPNGFGRGVHYFKPAKGQVLGQMESDPERVGEVILLARRAGMIPEPWVADERAPEPIGPLEFSNPNAGADWADAVIEQARLPRQDGQNVCVEVWCEAAGIAQRLANVAGDFGVRVYAGGGFDGLKGKRATAVRVASREVPTIALQIGDYDDHGWRIFTAVAEDVACWVPSYSGQSGLSGEWKYNWLTPEEMVLTRDGSIRLTVRRFGVTEAQVASGVVDLDDEGKAEAEAMPADWRILGDELNRLLLPAPRESVMKREPGSRKEIRRLLVRRWAP